MKKKLVIFVLIIALGYWFRADIIDFLSRFTTDLANLENFVAELKQISKQVSAPEPLRSSTENQSGDLTVVGTVEWTNQNRIENGVAALTVNAQLTAAAQEKVNDMFARQYFEHVAPDGTDAAKLVDAEGYEYVSIGENLALGNYQNDEVLLEAWMNSPGHRANILNANFQEIGVAVKQGMFEGHQTWLAVQEFGKPAAACASPDQALKDRIETSKQELEDLKQQIDQKRAELDQIRPKRGTEYEQAVQEYNSLVVEYNTLADETKVLVTDYNSQVNDFNSCAGAD